MAPADVEGLRAENARLAAEMATMKKKMMLAMKKQSAEVKLAQQRAEAAEAALAAASSGSPTVNDSHSENESSAIASLESGSHLSLDSSNGHVSSGMPDEGGGDIGGGVEVTSARDFMEEREAFASEARRNAEGREKLAVESRDLKMTSSQAIDQLMEKNRILESQLEEILHAKVEEGRASDATLQNEESSLESRSAGSAEGRPYENGDALPIAALEQQLKEADAKVQMLETELQERVVSQEQQLKEANAKVQRLEAELQDQVESQEQQLKAANAKVQRLVAELQERKENLQASEAPALDSTKGRALADDRVSDLRSKLEHANRQLEEESTKYTELDAKFGRLLKRSKQRIQEVQKEKDDLEVQFKALEDKATQALARQAALQADLDLTRNQAGDAIRNLDLERQQLNQALRRAKQDIEEMRQALEAKEHEITETSDMVYEKDQQFMELASSLKEAETNHEVAMVGLKDTHQKVLESYEMQLADAAKDRNKADETLSTLQARLADKESKLAEVEAASSGELVRLGALLDAARGDIQRLHSEHEKERESEREEHNSTVAVLLNKLEMSEVLLHEVERAAANRRSQLEAELEACRQALSATQAELVTARSETKLQTQELAAYKVRAHALLQKKEAALLAAQDSSSMAALESALLEAKAEAAAAISARDDAIKRLDATVAEYQRQLDAQAGAIEEAELHIRELATQLESSKALMKSQQAEYQRRLDQAEESLSSRSAVPTATSSPRIEELEKELAAISLSEEILKGEFESYKEMTNSMMTSKDEEIMRLLEEKSSLQKLLSTQKMSNDIEERQAPSSPPPPPLAEQQILTLARLQAQKEEEVARCLRHIEALQEEIKELEQENRLRCHQITILKEEYQNSERSQKRSGVDMTYVKNVILKLLETGEVEALLPVIAMLLQFSPEELRRCQEAYKMQASAEVPLSGAAAVVDAATAAPRSLLSRFTRD